MSGCIRAKITVGRLPIPSDLPGKMWAGKGSGRSCDACDQPITDTDIEYETDLPSQTLRFHQRCLHAWLEEHPSRMSGQPPPRARLPNRLRWPRVATRDERSRARCSA